MAAPYTRSTAEPGGTGTSGRPSTGRRRAVAAVAAVALGVVVAMVVRWPLFGLPPTADEGGYATVAHRWAQGERLYAGAWVDRPQGLMVLFRLLDAMGYTGSAVRWGAVAAAVVLTLAAGGAAWAVAGHRAALVAGLITAVVSAGPFVEGYALNGELAGSAVGTLGVAGALWWRRSSRPDDRMLAVSALLCGAAPLMKQASVDALVLLAVVVVAHRPRRLRPFLVATGSALLPVAAAVAGGAVGGWSRWWGAVVMFQTRLAGQVPPSQRLTQLGRVLLAVSPDLAGLALVAMLVVLAWSSGHAPAGSSAQAGAGHGWVVMWPVVVWAVTASLAAAAGPFSHGHYWIQAVAPLAVLASDVVRWPRRRAAAALVAVLAVPLISQLVLAAQPPTGRVSLVLARDAQRRADPAIAAWVDRHTKPDDSVYAFVASADLYLASGRDNGYPYLWLDPVENAPGALPALRAWLGSAEGPRWVVVYQKPDAVDPTGALASVLAGRYRLVTTIDGYPILTVR